MDHHHHHFPDVCHCRCVADVAITSLSHVWVLERLCMVLFSPNSYPPSSGWIPLIIFITLPCCRCHYSVFISVPNTNVEPKSAGHEPGLKFIVQSMFGVAKQSVSDTKKIMPFRFLQTQRVYGTTLQHNFHWHPGFNSSRAVQELSRTIQDLRRSTIRVLQIRTVVGNTEGGVVELISWPSIGLPVALYALERNQRPRL